MRPIHPIIEHNCKPFYGKPVCVVLKDGTEIVGTLRRLEGNRLILGDDSPMAKGADRLKKGKVAGKVKANTSALSPSNPAPGVIVLELALIAMLFALI